jgi:PIN domain nuclease of toxin-antitoxin system
VIVLDTHVLIWLAVAPKRLTEVARGAIEMDGEPAISTVSAQEISYLVTRGRIELDRPTRTWIGDVLSAHDVQPIAPSVAVAVRAGSISQNEFHGDPADRLIYATAVEQGARLVTADRRLRELDPPRIAW